MVRKEVNAKKVLPLRAWLLKNLDKGCVPGVSWVNKDKLIFRLPWLHGSSKGWSTKDNEIFRAWARHTGRFNEAQPPTPKKCKANFRCAMNSLKDIREKSDQTVRKGQSAYRVYHFSDSNKVKNAYRTLADRDQSGSYQGVSESLFRPRTPGSPSSETSNDSETEHSSCSHSDSDDSQSEKCPTSPSSSTESVTQALGVELELLSESDEADIREYSQWIPQLGEVGYEVGQVEQIDELPPNVVPVKVEYIAEATACHTYASMQCDNYQPQVVTEHQNLDIILYDLAELEAEVHSPQTVPDIGYTMEI